MRYILIPLSLLLAVSGYCTQSQNAYIDAGVPAADRVWSGNDLQRSAKILATTKLPLPALEDDASARLFARMTSQENLEFLRNNSIDIALRFQGFIASLQGAKELFKLYALEAYKNPEYRLELALFFAFMLENAETGHILANEFLPTIPKDSRYEARMAGLEQMKSGFTTMYAAAITSLVDDEFKSSEERTAILDAMSDTLPTLVGVFPAEVIAEFKVKMSELRVKSKDEAETSKIDNVLTKLVYLSAQQ